MRNITKHVERRSERENIYGEDILFHKWIVYTDVETGEVLAELIVPVIK